MLDTNWLQHLPGSTLGDLTGLAPYFQQFGLVSPSGLAICLDSLAQADYHACRHQPLCVKMQQPMVTVGEPLHTCACSCLTYNLRRLVTKCFAIA